MAWLGLAGVIGPAATGLLLLCAGAAGVPATASVPLIMAVAAGIGGHGVWRRYQLPAVPRGYHGWLVTLGLAACVAWTGWIASRSHLGWDGTVVWYHKARALAASDGAWPVATMADHTRTWSALEYPLQVPLAMAWVRLAQPVEDERWLKALPAAWCAAIFCLVIGAVLERSQGDAHARWRAAAALVVLATEPRLLLGEGSFTSGYADGPMAGLIAAFVWTAWRSEWGARREWQPLLAILGACLAWTKQEGLVVVPVVALACAWGGHWRQSIFAIAAALVAISWRAWLIAHAVPTVVAYAWPGAAAALARIPTILWGYLGEALDVRTWGPVWPGLTTALAIDRTTGKVRPACTLLCITVAGAAAFMFSAWADVSMHLLVTSGRQLLQVLPSLAIVAFSADSDRQR